jgi:hypothetical protein
MQRLWQNNGKGFATSNPESFGVPGFIILMGQYLFSTDHLTQLAEHFLRGRHDFSSEVNKCLIGQADLGASQSLIGAKLGFSHNLPLLFLIMRVDKKLDK